MTERLGTVFVTGIRHVVCFSLLYDVSQCATDCHWQAIFVVLLYHLASHHPLHSPSPLHFFSLGSCLPLFLSLVSLTHNDDLDQVLGKVKVGRQIASKQSALFLCANSVSSLSLSLSPSCLLSFPLPLPSSVVSPPP